MGGHYEKDIMKQLQEVMLRLDKTEQEVKDTKKSWKKEVKEVKEKFAVERKKLKSEIESLETELHSVKAENTELKKEIVVLKNENSKLRSQQNNDSSNSSLPPSTDQKGKKANTYNNREKSKKARGGQEGHKGTTLLEDGIKKKIAEGKLKHEIVDIGKSNRTYISRYKVDYRIIPTVTEMRFHEDDNGKINIPKEYRSVVIYGDTIKAMIVHLYSEGVVSNERICEFVNALGNNAIEIASGTVYKTISRFAKKCDREIEEITATLLSSEVLHTDATVISVNGKQEYVRNQSTKDAVLYSAMSKKSIESITENSILVGYNGILIHDHETAMYNFGAGHGECNAHLLRYLKKNTEESQNKWSEKLTKLLIKMNNERKDRLSKNSWFDVSEVETYEKEYDKIIQQGRRENEKTESQYVKDEEAALLNRLEKYKANHLLFIHDNRVPFDNNMSERDLRKCKNRQKMSGGFRSEDGQQMYCKILSVIETCKRKGGRIFEKIKQVFADRPSPVHRSICRADG